MCKLIKLCLTIFVLLCSTPFAGFAQTNSYPQKTVEMVVPWPAGGGTDAISRIYSEVARTYFSQTILVTNKPGAIGSIGFADVASAKPDGYKLIMGTPEVLIAPYLGIGHASYLDFIPIARINADPTSITVRSDSKWNTIEEFMAYAKSNPGSATLSTSGSGAVPDIAAVALEEKSGVIFTRVPYQGESPAIQAILAGQVDATVVCPGALSAHVKAGKLKILAVTSVQRLKDYPDTPTFKERGIDIVIGTWRGLMFPKGTPAEIVRQWKDLTKKVISDPKFLETAQKQNVNVIFEDSDAFTAVLNQENDLYKRMVPKLQIVNK